MNALLYYFIVLPLSKLPLWFLYRIADILYFLLITILPYRKKVIAANLALAFPEKSATERQQLQKAFYRHFADILIESVKNLSISASELKRRMHVQNPSVLEAAQKASKPILLVSAHYNNWEWLITAQALLFRGQHFGVGMPLSAAFWDQKLTQKRERFGLKVVHANTYQQALQTPNSVVLLLADQAPADPNKCLWLPFLNQDSPVIFGPEYIAHAYDCVVLYVHIDKLKRGYYQLRFEGISNEVKTLPYQSITKNHLHLLELDIQKNPANWLWSHKRWKRQKPANWPELAQALQQSFDQKFKTNAR
ncbi:MAG: hypothetical protein RLZZ301_1542 [Bacteroidota bacterium]|jgi:KDO2-lipid IV(A) lauroyltransferase